LSPEPPAPLVSVIVVSYNSKDHLGRCLESLVAHAGVEHEVIVVDNASSDGTAEVLPPRWPQVRWILNRENAGFARANNQGFEVARAPYWLVLNPDAELRAGALRELAGYLERETRAAVVGPAVERPDGRLERSAGFVPTPAREVVETLLLFRLGLRGTALRGAAAGPTPVGWVSGCAMLVRAAAAREVGRFDERFFMYFEDLDWCYRFTRAGWSVVYLPAARILHHRGASVLAAPDTLVDGGVGPELFVRKHGLAFPIWLLRVLRVVKLATRALGLWVRGLGGDAHSRGEARLFGRSLAHALGMRRGARP
jgi:GT2 family glycosyltransferase